MIAKNELKNTDNKIYEILIEKDNLWRKLNEEIDFSFVYEILKNKYSSTIGRTSIDLIRMFKFILLKNHFCISDRALVERTKTDMLFKFFLGYAPLETEFIHPSSLTVFRRERLKDGEKDLLEELLTKTVTIALEKNLISKNNKIIVDSTHSASIYHPVSAREELIKRAKNLRKSIYKVDENLKNSMPVKKESTGLLEDQIEYTQELIKIVNEQKILKDLPDVKEKLNYLEEMLDDTNYHLEQSKDSEAKVGHKTADTAFFGYKTHIAMTPERIITAAVVTSGEQHDGKQLKDLVKNSQKAGITVEAVIGDGAYSEKDNLEYCEENNIKNVSKLSKCVTHGNRKDSEFEYNKDAGMYVCPAGHMATHKRFTGRKKTNQQVESYFFDIEKCKTCPRKNSCYKANAKTKTYNVKVKAQCHSKQQEYMETEEFQQLYKERYKIEVKNAELKNNYNYGKANSLGLSGMTIQGAIALFFANYKRIIKLEEEKNKNI